MYNFSKQSIAKFKGINPKMISFMEELIKVTPYDFKLTWGVRTAEEQNSLYQQGRTKPGKKVTGLDGYKKRSNHQVHSDGLGYAMDIAIIVGGEITWDEKYYKAVGEASRELMKKYGIEWGGDWRNKDYPHFEVIS